MLSDTPTNPPSKIGNMSIHDTLPRELAALVVSYIDEGLITYITAGRIISVFELIKYNADYDNIMNDLCTKYHFMINNIARVAARTGNISLIRRLLADKKISPSKLNYIFSSYMMVDQRDKADADREVLDNMKWLVDNKFPIDYPAFQHAINYAPISAIEWIYDTCINPVIELDIKVKEGRRSRYIYTGEDLQASAIARDDINILEWLHSRGFRFTSRIYLYANQYNNFTVFEWLIKRNCGPAQFSIHAAARQGTLSMIMWLYEHGCRLDSALFDIAANRGDMNIINWLFENKCPYRSDAIIMITHLDTDQVKAMIYPERKSWNEFTSVAAVNRDDLDLLKWLHENKCPIYAATTRQALILGRINILNWLWANNFHVRNIFNSTVRMINELVFDSCLDWALDNKIKITDTVLEEIISRSRIKYMHKLQDLFRTRVRSTPYILITAFWNGNLECIEWLYNLGSICDDRALQAALGNTSIRSIDNLNWLAARRDIRKDYISMMARDHICDTQMSYDNIKWLRDNYGIIVHAADELDRDNIIIE